MLLPQLDPMRASDWAISSIDSLLRGFALVKRSVIVASASRCATTCSCSIWKSRRNSASFSVAAAVSVSAAARERTPRRVRRAPVHTIARRLRLLAQTRDLLLLGPELHAPRAAVPRGPDRAVRRAYE